MNFLKNIADKAKSVADQASPIHGLGGSGGARSPGEREEVGGQEGFLCPMCMTAFSSPEALQHHFEDVHILENQEAGAGGQGKQEQGDSLKFGRLGMLSSSNSQEKQEGSGDQGQEAGRDQEKSLLEDQVSALQESKTLLTSEIASLRKQLSLQNGSHAPPATNTISENKLLEKVNELAAENVGLKSAVDELSSEKSALEGRCKFLEKEEARRNTVDDAAVLKQELISVQKRMDETLCEKETAYNTVFYEKQQLLDELETLKKQLNDTSLNAAEANSNSDAVLKGLTEEKQNLTQLVQETQREVAALREKLQVKDAEVERLTTHLDSVRVEATGTGRELEGKTSEIAALAGELERERAGSAELRKEVAELTGRLEQSEAVVSQLEAAQDRLKKEKNSAEASLEEARSRLKELTAEKEDLQEKVKDTEKEVLRLTGERSDLLAQIEAGEGSNLAIHQLTAQNGLLQQKLADMEAKAREKDEQANGEREAARKELAEFRSKLDTETEAGQKLAKQVESLKSELETAEQNKMVLKKDLADKELSWSQNQSNHEDKVKRLTAEVEESKSANSRVVADKKDLEAQLQNQNEELSALRATITQHEVETEHHKAEAKRLNDELAVHKEAAAKAGANAEKLSTELAACQANLAESQAGLANLEAKVRTLEEAGRLEASNVKMLKEAKSALEKEKLRLELVLEERTTEVDNVRKSMAEEKSRIGELETVISATEGMLSEMREAIEAATGKEKNLLQDLEEKTKTITAIEEEKSSIVTNLETKQTILERLLGEKEAAEQGVARERAERESLEEQVCSMQAKWEKEREAGREEREELRTARELLLSQIVEVKEEREAVRAAAEFKEKSLKDELSSVQRKLAGIENDLESVQTDLATEKSLREAGEAEAQSRLEAVSAQLAASDTSLQAREREVARQQGLLDTAAVERDAALSKLLELEAAVGASSEERRGLLERCLAAESETERSRNITVELRRKMEDSQAALHELGRENQSLQVELSRQSGRKWKDDTEVVNCTSCQNNFSLTNRKHHCRNCGNIFCNECSSKQALMEGYKKPQRVCNSCFTELGTK